MDLFYYGSQDVPPPRRGDRQGPTLGRSLFCESCTTPVSPDDIRSGRASEVFGLVLCATCREAPGAEERVELYFCDRCQVSVPVYRVDTGEALSGDGRILCLDCRERATRSLLPGLAASIASVLIVGAGLWLGLKPASTPARPPAAEEGSVEDGLLEALQAELSRWRPAEELRKGLEGAGGGSEALRSERDRVLERLERAQTSFLKTRSEFGRRMDLLEGEGTALHEDVDALLRQAQADR